MEQRRKRCSPLPLERKARREKHPAETTGCGPRQRGGKPVCGLRPDVPRNAGGRRGGGLNVNRCRVLAVGKVRRGWIQEGIDLYRKRLPGLEVIELRDSTPQKEADAIQAALRSDERLIALMEEGDTLASIPFARRLERYGNERLAFVIGGADGLTAELKARASWRLSLSPMTFPHELARLMLIEQLFRAQAILQGSPYHRA